MANKTDLLRADYSKTFGETPTSLSDDEIFKKIYDHHVDEERKLGGSPMSVEAASKRYGIIPDRSLSSSLFLGFTHLPESLAKLAYNTGAGVYGIGKELAGNLSFQQQPKGPISGLADLTYSAGKKLLGSADTPDADAALESLRDHFGSWRNIKNTFAMDPVGTATLPAAVLSPARLATAAPGTVGRVARVADAVSRYSDPVNLATEGAIKVSQLSGPFIGGATSTSPWVSSKQYEAGRARGAASRALVQGLREGVDADEIVTAAREAVENLKTSRSLQYKDDMAKAGRDITPISFTGIDDALARNVFPMVYSRGISGTATPVSVNDAGVGAFDKVKVAIDEWKAHPPGEYHTILGMDDLKRKIGNIRDTYKAGTPEYAVAHATYSAIRKEIMAVDTNGFYAKAMRDYERASKSLYEYEKTLLGGKRATLDTTLRKLMSSTRTGVNANFDVRHKAVEELAAANPDAYMTERLAGAASKEWWPGGFGRAVIPAELAAGATTALMTGEPWLALPAVGAAMLASPRLVGESAHALGVASNYLDSVPPALRALRLSGYGASKIPPPAEDER